MLLPQFSVYGQSGERIVKEVTRAPITFFGLGQRDSYNGS